MEIARGAWTVGNGERVGGGECVGVWVSRECMWGRSGVWAVGSVGRRVRDGVGMCGVRVRCVCEWCVTQVRHGQIHGSAREKESRSKQETHHSSRKLKNRK